MKKHLPLLLLSAMFLWAAPAQAVFPDTIQPPEISMAEAVKAAAAALEPYLKEQGFGRFEDFQPLQASYIWRNGEWIGPGASTIAERGIWVVMFAPTPSAHVKIYVYIRREGREPRIFTLQH